MSRIPAFWLPFPSSLTLAALLVGSWASSALSQAVIDGSPATAHPERPPAQFATCSLCHGQDARGSDRAPSLVNSAELRSMTDSDIGTIISKGKNGMPAFSLPASDLALLVRYIRSLTPPKGKPLLREIPPPGSESSLDKAGARHVTWWRGVALPMDPTYRMPAAECGPKN